MDLSTFVDLVRRDSKRVFRVPEGDWLPVQPEFSGAAAAHNRGVVELQRQAWAKSPSRGS
jgi:hypothetical protein